MVDDSALALSIGSRIRERRRRAGLSQQRLAEGRYTKAYISALETGAAKPSMAALNFIAGRLGTTAAELLADPDTDLDPSRRGPQAGVGRRCRPPRTATARCSRRRPTRRSGGAPPGVGRGVVPDGSTDRRASGRRPRPSSCSPRLGPTGGSRRSAAYWLAIGQHLQDNPDEARSLFAGPARRGPRRARRGPRLRAQAPRRRSPPPRRIAGPTRPPSAISRRRAALSADLDDRRRGIVLFNLANGYRGAGDNEAAIRYGGQALTLLRAAEADLETAMLENNLALAYLAIGSTDAGRRARGRGPGRSAVATTTTGCSPTWPTPRRRSPWPTVMPSGRSPSPRPPIERAERAGGAKAAVDGWTTLARARLELGQTDEAFDAFAHAADLARAHAPAPRLREVLRAWADALAATGRHAEAYALAREALAGEAPARPAADAGAGHERHDRRGRASATPGGRLVDCRRLSRSGPRPPRR